VSIGEENVHFVKGHSVQNPTPSRVHDISWATNGGESGGVDQGRVLSEGSDA